MKLKQTYFTGAILGLIIILVIIVAILPLAKEIKKSYSSFISQKRELILLKMKAENLIKLQQQYLIFRDDLDKINEVFIDPETPIEFLKFLEEIAKNCQVPIEVSIGTVKEIKTDIWPSLSFQIFLKGSFPEVLKFIEKIENNPYLTKIEKLNIKRLSRDEVSAKDFVGFLPGDVRANLLIKVYTK